MVQQFIQRDPTLVFGLENHTKKYPQNGLRNDPLNFCCSIHKTVEILNEITQKALNGILDNSLHRSEKQSGVLELISSQSRVQNAFRALIPITRDGFILRNAGNRSIRERYEYRITGKWKNQVELDNRHLRKYKDINLTWWLTIIYLPCTVIAESRLSSVYKVDDQGSLFDRERRRRHRSGIYHFYGR
ncbi:hypothetical protein WA026_003638 [Henosepilachna vigintioctopunctata]|uniref:Uncharacterized protein n=1 Tax=Henosepilachna vigintioctopunctata TaxID=420089 RepID=A0AAW1U8B3_9CUCU